MIAAPPDGLVDCLRRARAVAVLTGAGVSQESGISTFRDTDGLWSHFDPDEVATPAAFRRDPGRVWRWYALRRAQMATSVPNAGHLALAALECRAPEFALITQNIDDLHRRAGSRNVIELHGNIHRVKCSDEGTVCDLPASADIEPPRCPRCGAYLRPDVVWFGEVLPVAGLAAAVRAAHGADVFLSVGTSATVEPAASLPFEALRRGATVVEVNPESTPLSPLATYRLVGTSATVLPPLIEAAWPDECQASSVC